jgi:hypothetical protein
MNASYKPKLHSVHETMTVKSLNDCLSPGTNLLPHVSSQRNAISTQFRAKSVPLTADIKKAFFTIDVRQEDRKYLRLVYDTPIRMCRVPFGVTCSPYLLQAVVLLHLRQSLAKGVITLQRYSQLYNCMYMDDIITCCDSEYEKCQFIPVVDALFNNAGMQIHKWKSAVSDPNDEKRYSSILGINWDRYTDVFSFKPPYVSENIDTKRSFLRTLASVFDPLGLLAPLVFKGKIIFQNIWRDDNFLGTINYPDTFRLM